MPTKSAVTTKIFKEEEDKSLFETALNKQAVHSLCKPRDGVQSVKKKKHQARETLSRKFKAYRHQYPGRRSLLSR